MQDIDAVYFSPGKIVANTKAIEDSVSSVATEAVSRSTPPSPIKRIMCEWIFFIAQLLTIFSILKLFINCIN